MHARAFTTHISPDKLDEALQIWQSEIAPKLKEAAGFKGAWVFGDNNTGRSLTITLWETEAAAVARDTSGESQQLGALLSNFFTEPPQLEMYEVKLQQ